MITSEGPLRVQIASVVFQNPIILAAGTAGYGRELADIVDLDALGGFVTKAVSPEPRPGNAALRVADFAGGMINAVGLANPGVEHVRDEVIPWLAAHHTATRKIVNVVGRTTDDFITVIQTLEEALGVGPIAQSEAVSGYELNVSCPNVKAGGLEFGADPKALATVVRDARAATRRPIFVKLSPTLPDIAAMAQVAEEHGADVISLVNTLPGLVVDLERRKPSLSFGSGGVSGPGLLPVGVLATWRVRQAVRIPLMGIGGVASAEDALQYIMAGATLVGVGTTAMKDPRRPERIVAGLARWCDREGVRNVEELVGALEWTA
ncbi:MAG: dihydroorotate dehydrogenase [Gemmatimonadaceae bacterium]|nr:dihydroorotate dehydrogenase [Gemmatimonadaceae bacterium]